MDMVDAYSIPFNVVSLPTTYHILEPSITRQPSPPTPNDPSASSIHAHTNSHSNRAHTVDACLHFSHRKHSSTANVRKTPACFAQSICRANTISYHSYQCTLLFAPKGDGEQVHCTVQCTVHWTQRRDDTAGWQSCASADCDLRCSRFTSHGVCVYFCRLMRLLN